MKTIHYISAAYLIISLALVLTRKHRQKFLAMVPPICQVVSILLLDAFEFPGILVAVLFLLNLALLVWVDMQEKQQMGLLSSEEEEDWESPAPQSSWQPEETSDFNVDAGLLSGSSKASKRKSDDFDLSHPVSGAPDLPEPDSDSLLRPDVENRPINEVAPVQQEIFAASEGEVEQIIEQMLESGDVANAKRYLRMLAFFAKDEPSRKLAEEKLAELNAAG